MIKQTTTLPVTDPEQPPPEPSESWRRWGFILAEVLLLAAIPVLTVLGFQQLLDSRAGEFAVAPGPDDPGWTALVEPSRVGSLVDVDDGRVAGVVLLSPAGNGTEGGTVILVSGFTEIDGRPLNSRTPEQAVEAVETALRLVIDSPVVLDTDGWAELLGGQTVELANPDPVPGDGDEVVVPAGRVVIGPSELAPLSARLPVGIDDPDALEFRRTVLWRTLLADLDFASATASATAASPMDGARQQLATIAGGVHRIETLPLVDRQIDPDRAEALVRSSVARPLGPEPGARLQVRIIDRSGNNDLAQAARNLGQLGFEVVQIGNAAVFDDGPTQLLLIPGIDPDEAARLAEVADADTVPPSLDPEAVSTATLLLGGRATIALPS